MDDLVLIEDGVELDLRAEARVERLAALAAALRRELNGPWAGVTVSQWLLRTPEVALWVLVDGWTSEWSATGLDPRGLTGRTFALRPGWHEGDVRVKRVGRVAATGEPARAAEVVLTAHRRRSAAVHAWREALGLPAWRPPVASPTRTAVAPPAPPALPVEPAALPVQPLADRPVAPPAPPVAVPAAVPVAVRAVPAAAPLPLPLPAQRAPEHDTGVEPDVGSGWPRRRPLRSLGLR